MRRLLACGGGQLLLAPFQLIDAAKLDAATDGAPSEPTYIQQRAGGGTEGRLDIIAYSDRVRQAMGTCEVHRTMATVHGAVDHFPLTARLLVCCM